MPERNARESLFDARHRYRTIAADPPWRYNSMANGRAVTPYETMSIGEIVSLPVRDICDQDAHLWLWTTNAYMEDAHRVARAWGFEVLTIVTWCKKGPGVGHYVRNNTEHVLFGSKGRPCVPADKPLSSWFEWPRGRHSEKPDGFYDLVEQVSPGPYLEMFSRRARLGWETWGDQALGGLEAIPA